MMAAFNITALSDLGYNETTRFLDPMDTKYRAKPFASNDYSNRVNDFDIKTIDAKCDDFTHMDGYAHVGDTVKALDGYWSSRGSGKTATPTTLKTSTTKTSSASVTSTLVTTKATQSTTKATTTATSSTKTSGKNKTR